MKTDKALASVAGEGSGHAVRSTNAVLTKGQRICFERGHHEDEEFIDPQSGGFDRCKTCRRDVDREIDEAW